MKLVLKIICVLSVAIFAACSGDDGEPCGGSCQANAHCDEATDTCVCDDGFVLEGEACVDPCDAVDCSGEPNTECVDGECVCLEGYHDVSGTCVEDDPCEGVDCSSDPNSHCVDGACECYAGFEDSGGGCTELECCGRGTPNAGGDACECDAGYNDDDRDLLCGPDTPGTWPPDLDSLWNGDHNPLLVKCIMPPCDICGGYPGAGDTSGTWIRKTTTLTSTCDENLASFDPRVIVDAVDEQEESLSEGLRGNCAFFMTEDDPPVPFHYATFYDSTAVTCSINKEIMGASVQLGWATYDTVNGTGVGEAKAYVVGIEPLFEDCELTLDVEYTRQ